MLGWRALLRLARRDALRHRGRSALVVLLIAIPVAALFLGAVLMRTGDLTDHQKNLLRLGSVADALVPDTALAADGTPVGAGATTAKPLPAGWRTAVVEETDYGRVKLGGRYHFASIRSGDLADPLLRGAYDLRSGRAPAADGEVAVSTEIARAYGVGVGDTVVVRRGDVHLTVTGTYERARNLGEETLITANRLPGSRSRSGAVYVGAPAGTDEQTIRTTVSTAFANDVVTRTVDPTRPSDGFLPVVILYTVGTIALFVVGIIVSAAFAVGARRQLRMLGLAGSNGASPRQLRLVVTAQGLVTGVVGVVVAAIISTVALVATAPHLDRLLGFRAPGLKVLPVDIALVAGLAVLTAVFAAYLPARTAARVPTLAALGGRRPLRPVPASVPVFGAVLFGLGLLLLAVGITSSGSSLGQWFRLSGSTVLLLLGTVLATPWFMGRLEPLAGRLSGSGRLAARGMARHRSRTGPICAAILAAGGGAMAVATFSAARYSYQASTTGPDRRTVQVYAWDNDSGRQVTVGDDVVQRIRAITGDAVATRTSNVGGGDDAAGWRVAGTQTIGFPMLTTDVASLVAAGTPADLVDAFRSGRALVHGFGPIEGGRLTLESVKTDQFGFETIVGERTLDAVEAPFLRAVWPNLGQPPCGDCQPYVLLPADAIEANGWTTLNESVSLTTARDLSDAQTADLRSLASTLQDEADERGQVTGDSTGVSLNFADSYVPGRDWLSIVLGGLVTVAALGVTVVGLALSAAEGRSELATLAALGAPPRLRRRVRAWEALLTAGIAGVLAVPLGVLPAVVVLYAQRRHSGSAYDRIGFPWTMALVVAVGVPVLAGLVAYATGRDPRRVTVRDE